MLHSFADFFLQDKNSFVMKDCLLNDSYAIGQAAKNLNKLVFDKALHAWTTHLKQR